MHSHPGAQTKDSGVLQFFIVEVRPYTAISQLQVRHPASASAPLCHHTHRCTILKPANALLPRGALPPPPPQLPGADGHGQRGRARGARCVQRRHAQRAPRPRGPTSRGGGDTKSVSRAPRRRWRAPRAASPQHRAAQRRAVTYLLTAEGAAALRADDGGAAAAGVTGEFEGRLRRADARGALRSGGTRAARQLRMAYGGDAAS
eukprot:TRINITY_DN7404_c0_g2_i2.p1 TRINITY_DN7404_c0_g2~~TRINITY_DN7404_c0_g2_i2.p1  ORF type:complete len:204 (-),score=43.04 TRINITY_DN7404_c0_g2_i2:215-826(-)